MLILRRMKQLNSDFGKFPNERSSLLIYRVQVALVLTWQIPENSESKSSRKLY